MRRFTSALAVISLVACLSPWLHAPEAHAEGDAADLTAEEKSTLARGELVARPKTESRGRLRLIGGTSFLLVDSPADVVWAAVNDTARFHNMLPQAKATEVLSRDDASGRIRIRHEQGPARVEYVLDLRYLQKTKVVMFQLNDRFPSGFEAGWGFIRLAPQRGNKTLVTFGAMVDLGNRLGPHIVKKRIHEWLLKVPLTMKWYLQGEGGKLYGGS
jgi:ribosome-associated toxin RatA of RatAB toxin-antitoxin module